MKDIGKSVKERLNNIAKKTNRQHSDLLQYYAMERFLYRLSKSKYRDKFLLKGALLLQSVDNTLTRATKDIDFIATSLASESQIRSMLTECLDLNAISDGITFDASSIAISQIQRDVQYHGHQVTFQAKVDTAKIGIQLDIGFGSAVIPGPIEITYP